MFHHIPIHGEKEMVVVLLLLFFRIQQRKRRRSSSDLKVTNERDPYFCVRVRSSAIRNQSSSPREK